MRETSPSVKRAKKMFTCTLYVIKKQYSILAILTSLLIFGLLAGSAFYAGELPAAPDDITADAHPDKNVSYYIELSISNKLLTLYERNDGQEPTLIARYPVGTAVRGLNIYPTGPGTVTGIYFNPWWHPTPYSRQVFRARGIELPAAVPPGHPLNYMGPFKIALSHRTKKGAIYRIHGNNNPKRVGQRVTGGCFVMDNKDGLELAHRIKVGTLVHIMP